MPQIFLILVVESLSSILCATTAQAGGTFVGSAATLESFYPNLSPPPDATFGPTTVVDPGVEFPIVFIDSPSGNPVWSADVAPSTIVFNHHAVNNNLGCGSGLDPFNGFVFSFGGLTQPIAGVTLNPSSTLIPFNFWASANQVFVDYQCLGVISNNISTILDVTFERPEACCFPNGPCEMLDPDSCIAAGGSPLGAGTACAGDGNDDGKDDACVPPCMQPPPGMVAWYTGDDCTPSDLLGQHDGTYVGTPDCGSEWKVGGGAMMFFPSTYVIVPGNNILGFGNPAQEFSIDAWIKVLPGDSSGVRPIVDKRLQIGDNVSGYALFLQDGLLSFQLGSGAGGSSICDVNPAITPSASTSCTTYESTSNVADGNWHLVSVTVQRTGGGPQVKLYVDDATSPVITGPTRIHANNNADLWIGSGHANPQPYLTGLIDELEIFERVLSPNEIQAIFDADTFGKCRPSCGSSARIISAFSRQSTGDIPINIAGRVENGDVTTDPRQCAITEVHICFDVPPCPLLSQDAVTVLSQTGCPLGTQAAYAPYIGNVTATMAEPCLILSFNPKLPNGATYKFVIGSELTRIAGQSIELRALVGDATSDGRVNAADRSAVVGVWTGSGFSLATDLNCSGQTNAGDRSAVIGAWTNPSANCAP